MKMKIWMLSTIQWPQYQECYSWPAIVEGFHMIEIVEEPSEICVEYESVIYPGSLRQRPNSEIKRMGQRTHQGINPNIKFFRRNVPMRRIRRLAKTIAMVILMAFQTLSQFIHEMPPERDLKLDVTSASESDDTCSSLLTSPSGMNECSSSMRERKLSVESSSILWMCDGVKGGYRHSIQWTLGVRERIHLASFPTSRGVSPWDTLTMRVRIDCGYVHENDNTHPCVQYIQTRSWSRKYNVK